MTKPTFPSTYEKRLRDLENALKRGFVGSMSSTVSLVGGASTVIINRQAYFSQRGPVAIDTSPPLDFATSGTISMMHLRLWTPGSTGTTVALSKNGTVIASGTIPATQSTIDVTGLTTAVAAEVDYINVAITAAGNGASTLTGWVLVTS